MVRKSTRELGLTLHDAAARYLKELKASGEEITPKEWRCEIDLLTARKQVDSIDMKAMREEPKAVERLRKAADQLARQERDKPRNRGRNGKGYGALPTSLGASRFRHPFAHKKTAAQVSPCGGSTLMYRTGRCASRCGPASAPAHRCCPNNVALHLFSSRRASSTSE